LTEKGIPIYLTVQACISSKSLTNFISFLAFAIIAAATALCAEESTAHRKPARLDKYRIRDSIYNVIKAQAKMRNYQVGILVNYYTDIRPESVRRVYEMDGPLLGIEADFRKNFANLIGFKLGSQVSTGRPWFRMYVDSNAVKGRIFPKFKNQSAGSDGWVIIANPYAEVAIGPIGKHVSFELGVSVVGGWVLSDTVTLKGSAGEHEYEAPARFSTVNARMGVSLSYGNGIDIIYSLAAKAWFGNPLTIPNSDLASLTISSAEGLGPGG
jgi:hypothetical protein